jgi:hypothetical protein
MRGYCIQRQVRGFPLMTVRELLDAGIIPATHSLSDRAIHHWPEPPHPRLAVTEPP